MNPAGFEPVTPGSKLPQTHALDRAATGTGSLQQYRAFILVQSFYFLNCHTVNSISDLEAGLEKDAIHISTKDCTYRLSRMRSDPH
jgi:hypothetical protein